MAMKAVFKPRIDLVNRTRLETVIPLKTPFIINIDPSDTCNFQCKFCPTGDRDLMRRTAGRGHGLLDFTLYKKVIDDLSSFPEQIKVVRLYKDGEPLMNPHLADMIQYAKESKSCQRVDTTTNASLLRPELSRRIIDAGLDRINISIEGINSEQYADFSRFSLDFDTLVQNITYFYEHRNQCEMIVKINGDILSEEQRQQFIELFGNIADGIFIESIMDCWPCFEQKQVSVNTTRGIYGQEIREVLICPYVFYSFSINSDGLASLCFLDWERRMIIGDAKEQSVKAIWDGKALRDYQMMFLRGERSGHPICRGCGQLQQGQPDDIDEYREALLEKVSALQ